MRNKFLLLGAAVANAKVDGTNPLLQEIGQLGLEKINQFRQNHFDTPIIEEADDMCALALDSALNYAYNGVPNEHIVGETVFVQYNQGDETGDWDEVDIKAAAVKAVTYWYEQSNKVEEGSNWEASIKDSARDFAQLIWKGVSNACMRYSVDQGNNLVFVASYSSSINFDDASLEFLEENIQPLKGEEEILLTAEDVLKVKRKVMGHELTYEITKDLFELDFYLETVFYHAWEAAAENEHTAFTAEDQILAGVKMLQNDESLTVIIRMIVPMKPDFNFETELYTPKMSVLPPDDNKDDALYTSGDLGIKIEHEIQPFSEVEETLFAMVTYDSTNHGLGLEKIKDKWFSDSPSAEHRWSKFEVHKDNFMFIDLDGVGYVSALVDATVYITDEELKLNEKDFEDGMVIKKKEDDFTTFMTHKYELFVQMFHEIPIHEDKSENDVKITVVEEPEQLMTIFPVKYRDLEIDHKHLWEPSTHYAVTVEFDYNKHYVEQYLYQNFAILFYDWNYGSDGMSSDQVLERLKKGIAADFENEVIWSIRSKEIDPTAFHVNFDFTNFYANEDDVMPALDENIYETFMNFPELAISAKVTFTAELSKPSIPILMHMNLDYAIQAVIENLSMASGEITVTPLWKSEKKPDEKSEEKPEEETKGESNTKPEEKLEEKTGEKPEDSEEQSKGSEKKTEEESEKKPDENPEEKPEEKPEDQTQEEKKPEEEQSEESEKKTDEESEKKPEEKPEEKPDEKPEEKPEDQTQEEKKPEEEQTEESKGSEEKPEEKKIEVSVGVDVPLKIDLDSMDESEKTEMADSIANGMRSDLEKLNPFEGGTTEVTAELVKVEGDQAVNRRRREVAAAVVEVETVYSTPPGADLAAVEIPEQNDLANQFTEAAKVALSSEAFKDVVDETQLENMEAAVEVDLPEFNPEDLKCDSAEKFKTHSIITCEPGAFGLTVPLCVFVNQGIEKKLENEIYITGVKEPTECYGQKQLDKVFFDAHDENCNTKHENNGTHLIQKSSLVYTNGGSKNSVITRQSSVRVHFACAYPLSIYVGLPAGIDSSIINVEETLEHEKMEVEVRMGVFSDDTFETQLEEIPNYHVEDPMFIGIAIAENPGDMEIKLKKCWATPSKDKEGKLQYPFIEDYCPSQADIDADYLQLYGSGHSLGFRLASFKFETQLCSQLYLHCTVSLCFGDECDAMVCSDGRKRREVTAESDKNEATLNSDSIDVCKKNEVKA